MTKLINAEIIYPHELTRKERQKFCKSLYNVHNRIFKGLNEKEFDHYVVNSPANDTKIFIYRNKVEKNIIGYYAVHRFEKIIENKSLIIFRIETGLLPEYRHKNADVSFWWKEAIKFKILHPNRKVFFLLTPINPCMYAILAKYIYKVYPTYNSVIPSKVEKLMMLLADEFEIKKLDESNPLIRKIGWITQADDKEKAYWQSSKNPHLRFYINSNPDFEKGNGLLTLIPLTFINLFICFFTFIIFYSFKKNIKYFLSRLREHQ